MNKVRKMYYKAQGLRNAQIAIIEFHEISHEMKANEKSIREIFNQISAITKERGLPVFGQKGIEELLKMSKEDVLAGLKSL